MESSLNLCLLQHRLLKRQAADVAGKAEFFI
jgi:hypothetical protein